MEIVASDASREIISQTEREGEAIETLGRQRGQIIAPERPVVIPGLVFHLAYESARDAPHLIGGLLLERLAESQGGHWVRLETRTIRQFQKAVNETCRVRSGSQQGGLSGYLSGHQKESLAGRRNGSAVHEGARHPGTNPGHHDLQ